MPSSSLHYVTCKFLHFIDLWKLLWPFSLSNSNRIWCVYLVQLFKLVCHRNSSVGLFFLYTTSYLQGNSSSDYPDYTLFSCLSFSPPVLLISGKLTTQSPSVFQDPSCSIGCHSNKFSHVQIAYANICTSAFVLTLLMCS